MLLDDGWKITDIFCLNKRKLPRHLDSILNTISLGLMSVIGQPIDLSKSSLWCHQLTSHWQEMLRLSYSVKFNPQQINIICPDKAYSLGMLKCIGCSKYASLMADEAVFLNIIWFFILYKHWGKMCEVLCKHKTFKKIIFCTENQPLHNQIALITWSFITQSYTHRKLCTTANVLASAITKMKANEDEKLSVRYQ